MSEAPKTPFDLLVDQIRAVMREELAAAGNGNGHGALLTVKQLAKALQVNKATVYEWVKQKSVPYYQAGRFIRFSMTEVLASQRKNSENPP